jgi:hypothetical protein
MSLETGLNSLQYLKKWFKSDDTLDHYFNTTIPYQGEIADDLIGWKAAYIKNWKIGEFGGLSYGKYRISSKYNCIRKACVFGSCNHCGFYSYLDFHNARKTYKDRFGTVLLKVAHYGTVFVHEKGYRSEEQEILSVSISNKCSRFLCNNSSTGLRKTGSFYGSACNKHMEFGTNINILSNIWGLKVEVIN